MSPVVGIFFPAISLATVPTTEGIYEKERTPKNLKLQNIYIYPCVWANLAPMAMAFAQSWGKTSSRLLIFFSVSNRSATTLA